jgi:molybdate transport system substrate-binding protein
LKKIVFVSLLLSSLLNASVNLALAANVSYAIDELIEGFHTLHPQININVTIGSSGKLTTQVIHGAPYDVFMSANMHYPQTLYKQKLTLTKPLVYAKGSLVLLSTRKRDFTQGVFLVEDSSIKTIAIANPKTAPYGIATKEFLENLHLYKKMKPKFVYGESISQTVAYTATATDLGFIAKSALFSKNLHKFMKKRYFIELDTQLYTPIKQGVVLLKHAQDNHDARLFYDFILSKQGKTIFKKYGYITQ